jgi:hypothetical protein
MKPIDPLLKMKFLKINKLNADMLYKIRVYIQSKNQFIGEEDLNIRKRITKESKGDFFTTKEASGILGIAS